MVAPQSVERGLATVLVVDDSPEYLAVFGELLKPAYRVLIANSGERGLELASSSPKPDLILLDVMMPGMDGYTVLAKLKASTITSDIPVVFASSMDADEDEQCGLDLGAADYITKPLRPAIVMARVRTQLELKQAQDLLKHQNANLEAEVARRSAENELILATAGEGIYGVDTNDVINFINPAAATMLGYGRYELLGRKAHASIHHSRNDGSPYPVSDCPLQTALTSGLIIRNMEDTIWRKDRNPLPVELSSMPMRRNGELLGAVVTFMDISDRKHYLKQLERRSNYDELTDLPNRNLMADRLIHSIGRCHLEERALAVLLFNLDRFKEINDTLGREIGDQALRVLSARLSGITKNMNTLARVAGDEFVVIVDCGEKEAGNLAQTLLETVAVPMSIGERNFFFSASLGIAVYPKDGENAEILLKNATAAMYKAKSAGGGVFRFYTSEMNARSLERFDMTNELRRALEHDEFVLHYQPQVSLHSGMITGCEALIRWQHPQRGLLSPGQFIPLAEDNGLIVPIGEWVLRTACRQNKVWQDAGLPPITMAVNMSAHQFAAQDVVALTKSIIEETGINPNTLELELTESAVMADTEAFIRATEELRALHVTLSIDDFGTGFSSLNYLKRFALDRLKIDLSFVRDITHDPNSASIALAIISLGHSLKLSVIAEGVETEAQLNFLRQRGCDEIQGYYFSKPLPSAELERSLQVGKKINFHMSQRSIAQTILLVDDEPRILRSLYRLLLLEGYQVLTAENALVGLEQMATHDIGVVIADARMPQMDGAEFLGKIRDMYPDCVRIMLSGYTDLKSVTEAVNKGELYKFLTKPWNNEELLETVRIAFQYYETRSRRTEKINQLRHNNTSLEEHS
jgi:diguanylate cyclase (GGDEF)-like protein/PAS domain S-box-containing protein